MARKKVIGYTPAEKAAVSIVKKSGALSSLAKGKEVTVDDYNDICDLIATGDSPVEACEKLKVSPQDFYAFKYLNKDSEEIQRRYDEAFTAKGSVYLVKAEESIKGMMEGLYDARTAKAAFDAYMRLAEVADKRYSSKPVIVEDRRSVTINQIDSEKILELHKLITG